MKKIEIRICLTQVQIMTADSPYGEAKYVAIVNGDTHTHTHTHTHTYTYTYTHTHIHTYTHTHAQVHRTSCWICVRILPCPLLMVPKPLLMTSNLLSIATQ
jgi:ABC-type nickel/cobalt efflux system permease component RcnA